MSDETSGWLLRALGHRIRELRAERGFYQESFADRCGVHRTFMGTVERGESNLSFQNIAKVAATLRVSLSILFADLEGRAHQAPDRRGQRPKGQESKAQQRRRLESDDL